MKKRSFSLIFRVQSVKLSIILFKLTHNKPLDLGGDGNSTHLTPSLEVLELFHSDTGGNGVHILFIPLSGISLLFLRYRHIITLSTCVSMYYLIISYYTGRCQCAHRTKKYYKDCLGLLLKTTCVSSIM